MLAQCLIVTLATFFQLVSCRPHSPPSPPCPAPKPSTTRATAPAGGGGKVFRCISVQSTDSPQGQVRLKFRQGQGIGSKCASECRCRGSEINFETAQVCYKVCRTSAAGSTTLYYTNKPPDHIHNTRCFVQAVQNTSSITCTAPARTPIHIGFSPFEALTSLKT